MFETVGLRRPIVWKVAFVIAVAAATAAVFWPAGGPEPAPYVRMLVRFDGRAVNGPGLFFCRVVSHRYVLSPVAVGGYTPRLLSEFVQSKDAGVPRDSHPFQATRNNYVATPTSYYRLPSRAFREQRQTLILGGFSNRFEDSTTIRSGQFRVFRRDSVRMFWWITEEGRETLLH